MFTLHGEIKIQQRVSETFFHIHFKNMHASIFSSYKKKLICIFELIQCNLELLFINLFQYS